MSEATELRIVCDGCGKTYKWKPQLAGKRVKCACGAVVTVPTAAVAEEPAELDDLYALASDAESKRAAAESEAPIAVQAPAPIVPPPTPVVKPGLAAAGVKDPLPFVYRRKGLAEEPKEQIKPSPLRDWVLPAGLVPLGLWLSFVEGFGGNDGAMQISSILITIFCNIGLIIGAVFIASAIAGVALQDPIPITIFKLCAVALAPGAIGGIIGNSIGGLNGEIVAPLVSVVMLLGAFLLLFRMAIQDMVICVMLAWIIRSGVMYAMWRAEGIMSDSAI
jgi:hypothetical protein